MTGSEQLVARAAIHDELCRLALAQDDRDWPTLTDCYCVDAVYRHPGGELVGVEAIVERTRVALSPLDASQHLLGTILVAVDGETATSSTYFQAQHVKVGTPGGDHLIIAGTYRDRWSYENGRWQIAERVQTYSWRDGNPEVTRRDRPPTEAS